MDDQVQIRGVRVEPEEVARAVRALPGIRDARVVSGTDAETGQALLTCYVQAAPTDADEVEQARRWRAGLAELLPQPMVPERWRVVAELPLTANGKWDRNGSVRSDTEDDAVASAVRQEWDAVLEVRGFADDARFFDLGGHSIKAITLLNRVRQRFGVDYPMPEFFADPTVRGMAARLAKETS